jgi:superfamily II DNA or RNA helicase
MRIEEGTILKIKRMKPRKRVVYDIEVKDNHNFFANGVLVKNCHQLPADTFSKLATIKTKYRFGLSATPQREDGRSNFIMALTGFPVGLDWRTIMIVLGKEYHTVNVHVVKDMESKYQLVKQLYNPERRTIIFINLLDVGRRISDMLEIPMISGETKKRLEIIKSNKSFVASRVLELGISIKDLEQIIEVDFLFGSRREELQRTGRLMHSIVKGKVHDIIFTKSELEQYGKRLFSLYERGFRYKLIPHMAGIQIEEVRERKKSIPTSSKNYSEIVEKLYKEGYFVVERRVKDVCKEAQKRGIMINTPVRIKIFQKLDNMVKTEKLFKIKMDKGYRFKQR